MRRTPPPLVELVELRKPIIKQLNFVKKPKGNESHVLFENETRSIKIDCCQNYVAWVLSLKKLDNALGREWFLSLTYESTFTQLFLLMEEKRCCEARFMSHMTTEWWEDRWKLEMKEFAKKHWLVQACIKTIPISDNLKREYEWMVSEAKEQKNFKEVKRYDLPTNMRDDSNPTYSSNRSRQNPTMNHSNPMRKQRSPSPSPIDSNPPRASKCLRQDPTLNQLRNPTGKQGSTHYATSSSSPITRDASNPTRSKRLLQDPTTNQLRNLPGRPCSTHHATSSSLPDNHSPTDPTFDSKRSHLGNSTKNKSNLNAQAQNNLSISFKISMTYRDIHYHDMLEEFFRPEFKWEDLFVGLPQNIDFDSSWKVRLEPPKKDDRGILSQSDLQSDFQLRFKNANFGNMKQRYQLETFVKTKIKNLKGFEHCKLRVAGVLEGSVIVVIALLGEATESDFNTILSFLKSRDMAHGKFGKPEVKRMRNRSHQTSEIGGVQEVSKITSSKELSILASFSKGKASLWLLEQAVFHPKSFVGRTIGAGKASILKVELQAVPLTFIPLEHPCQKLVNIIKEAVPNEIIESNNLFQMLLDYWAFIFARDAPVQMLPGIEPQIPNATVNKGTGVHGEAGLNATGSNRRIVLETTDEDPFSDILDGVSEIILSPMTDEIFRMEATDKSMQPLPITKLPSSLKSESKRIFRGEFSCPFGMCNHTLQAKINLYDGTGPPRDQRKPCRSEARKGHAMHTRTRARAHTRSPHKTVAQNCDGAGRWEGHRAPIVRLFRPGEEQVQLVEETQARQEGPPPHKPGHEEGERRHAQRLGVHQRAAE